MVTLGFFTLVVLMTKFSGKLLGRTHHIPSVSSSKGLLQRNREMRPHEWWAWMSTEQEPCVNAWQWMRFLLAGNPQNETPSHLQHFQLYRHQLVPSQPLRPASSPQAVPPPSLNSWWPSAALTRFARSAPVPGWWCWPLWSRQCQPSPWSTSGPWGDSHSWGVGGAPSRRTLEELGLGGGNIWSREELRWD